MKFYNLGHKTFETDFKSLIFCKLLLFFQNKARIVDSYSMLHVTWTTFKFNRNQLGTVSTFVMISVPWSNQSAHQVISEKLLTKEFFTEGLRTTRKVCSLKIKIILQISDEISASLTAALGFKWNPLWH